MEITKSQSEILFEGALPNNTSVETHILPIGGTLGGLEIIGQKESEITLSGNLTLEISTSDCEDKDFSVLKTFEFSKADIDKGIFFNYAPTISDKVFFKIKLSTTDSSAKGNISLFVRVNRR